MTHRMTYFLREGRRFAKFVTRDNVVLISNSPRYKEWGSLGGTLSRIGYGSGYYHINIFSMMDDFIQSHMYSTTKDKEANPAALNLTGYSFETWDSRLKLWVRSCREEIGILRAAHKREIEDLSMSCFRSPKDSR